MITVCCSDFVKRQTKESRFAHYDGDWHDIEIMVMENFHNRVESQRDGICLVRVNPYGFWTSIVPIKGNESLEFITRFEARREGEEPVVHTVAVGDKSRAKRVDIVLYRSDVLEEDGDRSTEADWEIVSINASPTEDEVPLGNTTTARNVLRLEGGTDRKLEEKSKEELIEFIRDMAKSAIFWSQHVMVEPRTEK